MRRHALRRTAGPVLWMAVLLAALPAEAAEPQPVAVAATLIPSFSGAGKTRFGRLEYRGGLVLSSTFADFGGLSSLSLDPSGTRFIAASDQGRWFAGRIEVDGDRPVALAEVVSAPMLGPNGRPLAAQGRGDVESLVRTPDGYAVGIERRQELWRYAGANPLMAKAQPLPGTEDLKPLGYNEGIEALIYAPVGTPPRPGLIAVAERSPTSENELPGFLFAPKLVGRFTITRDHEFNATDMTLADDGMVYLLERRFNWLSGVAMRIRRFSLAEVKPGAVIEGEILIEAERNAQIDNMEALAVHRNAAGETILTIMSDDNFSKLERTLLLRFAVVE